MKENKVLFVIVILFFLIRFIPYMGDMVPTGYDAGIYMHVMKTFPYIPSWLMSSFYSAIFSLTLPLAAVGLSPEAVIVPFAMGIQLVLFCCIFVAVKRLTDWKTALIAVFLLSISAVQIRAYWFFYLKYILSIAFFFSFLSFLGKRSYYKATLWGIVTGITHLLTFGILLAVFALDIVLGKRDRKKKTISFLIIAFVSSLFYLPFLSQTVLVNLLPTVDNLLSQNMVIKENLGGTFYPIYVSLLLTGLYLPLALYGIFKTVKEKREELRPFLITLVLTLLFVVIKASFFRRIFIITDVILLFYAAIGFSLIKDMKKFYIAVLIIFAVIFTFKTSDKLMLQATLQEVSFVKKTIGNNYLVSLSKEDTAWLLGYTDAKIIAWDYGGYNTYWNTDQWETFLNPQVSLTEKRKLMKLLPAKAYIYVSDSNRPKVYDMLQNQYLEKVSPHVYRLINK